MNKKLLDQLALAKQAGTQSMAKDFFAKTPSPGTEPAGDDMQTSAAPGGEAAEAPEAPEQGLEMEANGKDMSPEELQQLLQMLESQGGGQG